MNCQCFNLKRDVALLMEQHKDFPCAELDLGVYVPGREYDAMIIERNPMIPGRY